MSLKIYPKTDETVKSRPNSKGVVLVSTTHARIRIRSQYYLYKMIDDIMLDTYDDIQIAREVSLGIFHATNARILERALSGTKVALELDVDQVDYGNDVERVLFKHNGIIKYVDMLGTTDVKNQRDNIFKK